jgi:hypothetical protein
VKVAVDVDQVLEADFACEVVGTSERLGGEGTAA